MGSCPPPCSALGRHRLQPASPPLSAATPLGFAPGRHLGRSRWCGRRPGPRRRGPWRWSDAPKGPQWRSRRLSPRRSSAGGPSKARAARPRRPAPWCHGTRPAGPRTAAGDVGVSTGASPCPPSPGHRASPGTGCRSPPRGGGWPRPHASGCRDCLTVTTGASPPCRPVSAAGAVSLGGGGVYTAQSPTPRDPPSPEPPRGRDRARARGPPGSPSARSLTDLGPVQVEPEGQALLPGGRRPGPGQQVRARAPGRGVCGVQDHEVACRGGGRRG